MSDDLFLDLLLKLSVSRLREMRSQVDDKRQHLDFEAHYLDRALEAKGAERGPNSGDRSKRTAPGPSERKPRGKASNKREPIKQIMRTDPDRYWLPSEIRDQFAASGIETTAGAVRVTMKRMLDDRELERPPDGGNGFKLAEATLRLGATANGSGNGTDALQPVGIRPEGGGS